MDKFIQLITLDGQKFQASKSYHWTCNGCAFEGNRQGCLEANDIISCSGEHGELIFTQFSMLSDKQPMQKQDSIVAEIRELLLQRSETGITKYGTTLDRKDLKPSEWCQHLLEELLDASGYVLRLKKDLESIEKITTGSKE